MVEEGCAQALAVLRDKNLSPAQKGQKIEEILKSGFDFDTFSRLALGPTWAQLSDAQREEFVKLFTEHVLGICRHAADQYINQEAAVSGDRPGSRGDWTVHIRIFAINEDKTQRNVATVAFRLRQKDGRWRVIDLTIDGISMAVTFRAQFVAVMSDGGIDRVLQVLRQKNAARHQQQRNPTPAK